MLIRFWKPFGVLSQFSDAHGRPTLADFVPIPNIYPAGRLDFDSEGLLLLTDDGFLQDRLASPKHKLTKKYWVLVEGEPTEADLEPLRQGLQLNDGSTLPALARIVDQPSVPDRTVPLRTRKDIRDTWLEISIREGRNRQVRRMTAAIGFPTLRLIRFQIGPVNLAGLVEGRFEEVPIPVIRKIFT